MKFTKLAAALALVAAAPAFAAIDGGNPSGNGELSVTIFDAGYSYTLDLGLTLTGATAFNGASSYSYTLDSANWNAFFAASGSSASDLQFAVFGGDNTGGTAVGGLNLFSTVNAVTSPLGNTGIQNATNSVVSFATALQQSANGTHDDGGVAFNGDSYDALGSAANFVTAGQVTFNAAAVGWTNSVQVGTDATFRSFSRVAGGGATQTAKTDFAGVWSVEQTPQGVWTVQYSAVPEPGSVALMLAGLGVMGFVARRRTAK